VRVVLLGPPGAGKGTQAKRLAERFGLAHISTGDIFRDNVQRRTELGALAKSYMDKGELVPDDVTVRLLVEALLGAEAGFILDGFPRNIPQAEALDRELAAMGRPLQAALAFVIDDEVAVMRIAGRRTCNSCQHPFNVKFDPPRTRGVCDACGGELVQRPDDDEDVVRRRLEVYHESTAPVIGFYARRGLLREVDANAEEEDVTERAMTALRDLAPVR
jgi:adenylate kinase